MKTVTIARVIVLSTFAWVSVTLAQSASAPSSAADPASPGARYAAEPAKSHIDKAISAAFASSDSARAAQGDDAVNTRPAAHICSTESTPSARACRDMPGATDAQGMPLGNDLHGRSMVTH